MKIDKFNPPEPKYAKDMRELQAKLNQAPNPITENYFIREDNPHVKLRTKASKKNRR